MIIVIGILVIILLMCLFAIILILSYDFFDYKILDIKDDNSIMPGINCGICGYLNCAEYYYAVLSDNEQNDLCSKDISLKNKFDSIIKKNINKSVKNVAKIFCLGDETVKTEYIFNGEDSCTTIYSFYKGEKICKDACIGKGDCMKLCPTGAIKKDKSNRVWIDSNLCNGCKICMKICPSKVIRMVPENGGYFIACSSHHGELFVKKVCGKGCINCRKCDAIVNDSSRLVMDNNLAFIRYNSKRNIYDAAISCPTDVIVPIKNQKLFMVDQKANKTEL